MSVVIAYGPMNVAVVHCPVHGFIDNSGRPLTYAQGAIAREVHGQCKPEAHR